ncbi:MAG: hypothetical protein ABIL49_04600 [candidate division WOR-3 bacterium]
MKRYFIIFFIFFGCSKKVTSPENPKNPYEAFSFWNIKPNSKFIYGYSDSSIYKYSFYYTLTSYPNPDTLVRTLFDTMNLSIPIKDSIWLIADTPRIRYDTIKIVENGILFKNWAHEVRKEISVQKFYPYTLTQNWTPIQKSYSVINDSVKIGSFFWSCSLMVYLDTLYIDSSKGFSNKINDTLYSLYDEIFMRIKYRYKFDKIVLNQGLECKESDTIIKQNYAYKLTKDSIYLVPYKGITYRHIFDTLYAHISHHTNAEASIQISRNIKWKFIKNE